MTDGPRHLAPPPDTSREASTPPGTSAGASQSSRHLPETSRSSRELPKPPAPPPGAVMTEAGAYAAAAAIVGLVRAADGADDDGLVRTIAARLLAAHAAGHAEGRPFWAKFENRGRRGPR